MSELQTQKEDTLKQLLSNSVFLRIPKAGDLVKGRVVSLAKNEVRVDIEGFKTGVVRGVELFHASEYRNLNVGDEIEATVMSINNEHGDVELSFRFVGLARLWSDFIAAHKEGKTIEVKVGEVNKGGLVIPAGEVTGFLPVSQLAPEHYPRVQGGDKSRILEKLREFTGKSLRVKIIDVSPEESKLIFSEKAVWEEEQKDLLTKYKVGDVVEGKITAIADFGVFVAFDNLEGLVHISEIAWQRLDHPSDLLKVGETIRAQVVGIEGSKIFLSMRKLLKDPWMDVSERYKAGQIIAAKVLKVNPFGLFVELDSDIHGLVHVSELDIPAGERIEDKIKPGDTREFKIISVEPEAHRLGLSEKALRVETKEAPAPPEETTIAVTQEPTKETSPETSQ